MGKRKKARVSVDVESSGEEEHMQQPGENDDGEGSSAGKSLYEILGVERTASKQEIKKAYHRLALRLHPDKNPDDEEAKENFQQLQKVISILGDEEKRALYDQTGIIDDDDLAGEAAQNLHDYFRTVYKRVTPADIEEFEANYRGSDLEKNDLIKLYNECKGDMNKLFCKMLCSDPMLDSHRFKDVIDETIASGELEETKAYKKWRKKVSKSKPPTSPLRRREKSKKSDKDLYAIISQRRNERKDRFDSMFSSMISKYGGAENSGGSEPTEEEFEAAQKKVEKSRKSSKKQGLK